MSAQLNDILHINYLIVLSCQGKGTDRGKVCAGSCDLESTVAVSVAGIITRDDMVAPHIKPIDDTVVRISKIISRHTSKGLRDFIRANH